MPEVKEKKKPKILGVVGTGREPKIEVLDWGGENGIRIQIVDPFVRTARGYPARITMTEEQFKNYVNELVEKELIEI